MKNKLKTVIPVMIIICLFAGLFSGCGKKAEVEPVALVQGALDARYKNLYSDEYLTMTEKTKETMEAEYEDLIQVSMEAFAEYFTIDLEKCGSTVPERIREILRTIYAESDYEIGTVIPSGESYLVSVTLYPSDAVQMVMAEDWQSFEEDWIGDYENLYTLTDAEFEQAWAERILELFEARIETMSYMNPETISIQITQDGDYFTIINTDYERLDNLMIEY